MAKLSAPKSEGLSAIEALSRTLQSMSQRFPTAKVVRESDAFGVLLDDRSYLYVAFNGQLAEEEVSALVGLFAIWLAREPAQLVSGVDMAHDGLSLGVIVRALSRITSRAPTG